MDLSRIGNFIKKQKVSFICSVDENGYPNMKAILKPRKMNGEKEIPCFIKRESLTRIIVF